MSLFFRKEGERRCSEVDLCIRRHIKNLIIKTKIATPNEKEMEKKQRLNRHHQNIDEALQANKCSLLQENKTRETEKVVFIVKQLLN